MTSTVNSAVAAVGPAGWRWALQLLGLHGQSKDNLGMAAAATAIAADLNPVCDVAEEEGAVAALKSLVLELAGSAEAPGVIADAIKGLGRAGRWRMAVGLLLEVGEASSRSRTKVGRTWRGADLAALLWSQATYSTEASQRPGSWLLPKELTPEEAVQHCIPI